MPPPAPRARSAGGSDDTAAIRAATRPPLPPLPIARDKPATLPPQRAATAPPLPPAPTGIAPPPKLPPAPAPAVPGGTPPPRPVTKPTAAPPPTPPARQSQPAIPARQSQPAIPATPLAPTTSGPIVMPPASAPPAPPPAPSQPPEVAERKRFVRVDTDPGSLHLDVRGVRSALVGRDQPLGVLRDVVSRAVDFQAPQLVTVVGNQGTGKSRLIAELVAGVKSPIRVYHGRARQDGERYAAIATLLRDRFQLAPGDADPIAHQRFAAEVKEVMGEGQVETLHFLGSFVGLDFPPSPFLKVVAESPRQKDEIARTVLRRFIELDASKSPLVLVLDDLQWADDATLSLVSELASGLGGSPIVILASTRPEMLVRSPGWGQGAVDHERIDLRNLEPDDAETMFRNLLAKCGTIPADIADAAVEMTGGNPYFLEQLVRLFLGDGTIDASGPTWKLDADRAAAAELPISIEEAIEARIAALERDERDLLEKAAVFGNVFWLSAVIALSRLELEETAANDALDYEWGDGERTRRRMADLVYALAERDYLLPLETADSTLPGDIEIVFKHNLERELVVKSTEPG
ncbi:MAG TPA: AAA family ATPase, partial [Kofleriaceae bacterium]|nr:AAA family ATPase [Kofleriaceae bacterium]